MKTGLVIAGLLLVGCGSSSTSADAPLAIDGPVTPMPDAKPGTPDAKPGTPDAPVTVADAPPGTPDAPPSQMCFPQCYIETLATLVGGCAPTGSCTTHTDIGTFTTTTCYANGVKFVSAVNIQSQAVTLTVKKSGATCYTQTSMATGQTSASLVWKDSGGTQVLEVDVPDTSMFNLENVICGSSAPVAVDLNSASCQSVRPDAGVPDGGTGGCTQDPACTP